MAKNQTSIYKYRINILCFYFGINLVLVLLFAIHHLWLNSFHRLFIR